MSIGIIDADLLDNGTRHPNLALMKISGYYKEQGYKVQLITEYKDLLKYDKIFVSKVFTFTKIPDWVLKLPNVEFGGTGFFCDGGKSLEHNIEHHMPDYNLYDEYIEDQVNNRKIRKSTYNDYKNYSIGFSTRGCFRKCEFCVNKKYDHAFKHSPIKEFLDPTRPYICLWDDNFLAYNGWEKILDELEETKKPFQFRQGLDIRLLTDKKAKRLANSKYHGDFIFAFDHVEDKELIMKKLKLWKRYSSKTTKLYVLCAYDSQDEKDIISTFERIKILMQHGCLPYIMRYEDYKGCEYQSMYTQIARWCNQPQFLKKKSFRQFCEANQDYHRSPDTLCSAYSSMLEFEKKFPEIAEKYYDLRYEEENMYDVNFGFERKYPHKQDCDICVLEQKRWVDAYNLKTVNNELLNDYFTKEIDLQCLLYKDNKCSEIPVKEISDWFCICLLNTDIKVIIDILKESKTKDMITSGNIPQFSSMEDGSLKVVDTLYRSGIENMTFENLGFYLNGCDRNKVAKKKYGENHSKFSALLDLTTITTIKNRKLINMSVLGNSFKDLSEEQQKKLLARLILRIPIIQYLFIDALDKEINVFDYMHGLSNNTKIRRKPNVMELIRYVKDQMGNDLAHLVDNIKEIMP